jgi:hypothetical protein
MVLARGASESGAQVVRAALDLWLAERVILVGGMSALPQVSGFIRDGETLGQAAKSRERLCNASPRRSLDGGQFTET